MAEEFETWLHQLNEAFVASTTASLDVEEALRIVKRRAASDLKNDGGPDRVLAAAAHRSRNQASYPLEAIIEPVTCDDVDFGGFVVPFRLHRSAEQPPGSAFLKKNCSQSTIARRYRISLKVAALFAGFFVLAGIPALIFSGNKASHVVSAGNLRNVSYGIAAQPQVGTSDSKAIAGFALLFSPRGSGSVHYVWKLGNSSQPESSGTVIFSGHTMIFSGNTENFYHPFVSCGSGQLPHEVAVVITSPDPSLNMEIHVKPGATCYG